MKSIVLLFSILVLFSCKKMDDIQPSESFCYSFDVRGCETDQYSESILVSDTQTNRETAMIDWLKDHNIQAIELNLEIQYYEAYCEACYVCTNGDRYFFKTNAPISEQKVEGLEFLNFQSEDCL